jgi:hypothetical protein
MKISELPLKERLDRARTEYRMVGKSGPFCICGEYEKKCQYHKEGADPVMGRAADLMEIISRYHHDIDYDSCSLGDNGAIKDIAEYLRGFDG